MAQTKTARQKISRLPRSIAKELEVNGDDAVLWLTKAGESKLAALEKNVKFKNARDDLSSLANAKWRITPDGNNITAASDYFKFSFRRRPQGGWALRNAEMPMVVKNKTIGEYIDDLGLMPHKDNRGTMPNLFIRELPAQTAAQLGFPEWARSVIAYPSGVKTAVRNAGRIHWRDKLFSYMPQERAVEIVNDGLFSPELFAQLRREKPETLRAEVGAMEYKFKLSEKDGSIILTRGEISRRERRQRKKKGE